MFKHFQYINVETGTVFVKSEIDSQVHFMIWDHGKSEAESC